MSGEHFSVAVEIILHLAFLINAVDFKQLSAISDQHWIFLQLLLNWVGLFLLCVHISVCSLLLLWKQLCICLQIVLNKRGHVLICSVICLIEERASFTNFSGN